jgi:hypothetical protein
LDLNETSTMFKPEQHEDDDKPSDKKDKKS